MLLYSSEPPSLAQDAVNFTATQDWYWDERHEGRIIAGAFANSITFNQLNCDPQHTGHPTPSCIERMRSYAPYHECLSVAKDGPLQVWGGPLAGGDFAVLLLNRGPLNGAPAPRAAVLNDDSALTTSVSYEYLQPLSCACVAGRRHGAPHHRVLGGARPSSVSAHEGQGRHRKAGPWRASGVRDCDCGAARCRVLPAEPRVRTESRDCVFHPTQVCLLITHATSAKTVARRMCSLACTRLPASPSTPSPAPLPSPLHTSGSRVPSTFWSTHEDES